MGYDPGRFLNSPGEFWTCPKCTLVLRDPVQICDNSHSICSSCSLSTVFHQCPAAGCSGTVLDETNRRPDATASRFLSSQTIRCANGSDATSADAACDWVGPLAAENMHAITCLFVATSCPHTGCTFRARSSALPTHLRTCPYRLVRCPNASLNAWGGSPRKGCAYKGPLNTMDQHLMECNHNPCPQACYGCLFTNTMAVVEQHASECKDLLFRELCELRKRVASQQGPTPSTGPPGAQPGGSLNDVVYKSNQMGQEAAPLLMTPPSTDIPSSELGANEHNTFDATVIPEDPNTRQRSTSILDLDVDIEDPMEDTQPSAMERNSASDEDMEDGEVSLFEDEAELIVEAVGEDEEENAGEDESGEEDVLREIGLKTELQAKGSKGIPIYITENVQRPDFASSDSNIPVSPPFQQGSDTPTVLSPPKTSAHAPIATGDTISKDAPSRKRKSRQLPSKSAPRVATSTRKASDQPSSQAKYPPNSNFPAVRVDATTNSSTVLGYGYMERGQIFPRSMVPHEPSRESPRDEAAPRTSRIKMVRDVRPPPPPPEVDAFGPIRTNMHRRNNAISHTRGSHPYLLNGVHPRQIPPGPPNVSGPGRRGPVFPLPPKPPFMEEQYHLPHATRGPGDYQRYPPNAPIPPPYNWPSRPYSGGPPIPAPAHLRGHPPQMRRDFEREGFEASREYRSTFDTRMTRASSRRPFSTYPIEADYVHPPYSMHTYENLAMEDTQSRSAWHGMQHYPPSWHSYDAASCEHNRPNIEDFSHSFLVSQQNAGSSHPSISTIPPKRDDSHARSPPNSHADAAEGNTLELKPRPEAKSASPVVASIPPQKRPPKVSATPLKPIRKISKSTQSPDTEKGTNSQGEKFTPSLLAQPPIEHLQESGSKETHHAANATHDDTSNIVESSDEDQPLAQKSSATRKPQSPQNQSLPGVVHDRKKSTPVSVAAKTAGLHKGPEETPLTTVSESRTSSPTKRPAAAKGRFVHVPEEEFLAKDTLVDRPPKLFRKRITRSGKEFHSGDDESNSDGSDDPEVALESPERQYKVPAVQGSEAQMSQVMETVRSPSGIKTRGLKVARNIGSRTKSAVQLAIPVICGPTEDETTMQIHSDLSEASSKDVFVPTRRAAGEIKSGRSNLLKLKPANPRGRGRGRRGRGIGRGRGKAEAWGPQSTRNKEEDVSIQCSEDAAALEIQGQVGGVGPIQGMFLSGNTTSSLSFPISHSRTIVLPSKDAPKPSPVTPSGLLAAHTAAQSTSPSGALSLVDLFPGMDTSSISPVHSAVITNIAPSSTWNVYALTSQLGTDEDSGLASSMDFEFDPVEQLQLDEWTNLDMMNREF